MLLALPVPAGNPPEDVTPQLAAGDGKDMAHVAERETANVCKDHMAMESLEVTSEVGGIPKADLHLHAEAGPRLHRILAVRSGKQPFDWRGWAKDVTANVPAGPARLERMSVPLISDEDDAIPANFLARVTDVLEESARSGAVYVEVRFGQGTILRPDFMALFRLAEASVASSYPGFMAEPLATLVPQIDPAFTEQLVSVCIAAAKDGLAGVDIIPQPYVTEADWRQTYEWAERLAAAGLHITVHAGEFSTANVAAALQVPGIRRIGHGVQIAGDQALTDKVASANVALECCTTSNVILGAVTSLEAHPLPELLARGLKVTLNTDNPVRFGTSIAREYELASRLGMSKRDLEQATKTAIEFAFTTEERKRQLRDAFSAVSPD